MANKIESKLKAHLGHRLYKGQSSPLDTFKGKTVIDMTLDSYEMTLIFHDLSFIHFEHMQDCCETVEIEDVIGDMKDLLFKPLEMIEEICNYENDEYGSSTWTFYKFRTMNGDVTVRWLGNSNGYYSESVDWSTGVLDINKFTPDQKVILDELLIKSEIRN